MNTDILRWGNKASYPWIIKLKMEYDGTANNGMPDNQVSGMMDDLEDEIGNFMRESEGYINIGRETGNGSRTIYFACIEFRNPPRILDRIGRSIKPEADFTYDYEIYKDKYWRCLSRYAKI